MPTDRPFQIASFDPMNGFFVALFLSPFFSPAFACIAFGGCLLEYPGGCAPPVPGYFANCYGGYCRRNKANGLRTMALNGTDGRGGERWGGGAGRKGHGRTDEQQKKEPSSGDQFTPMEVSPDVLFLECCQSWALPPPCLLKCSYSNYTAEMLRSMFFRSDDCPIESASVIHFCATQNLDHSLCCRQNGILTTRSGDKCLVFCEQLPTNETRLDLSYVPCFERFSEMKKCFYESALRTIDYLEAEFDQMKKEDDKMKGEREEEGKGKKEENEREEEKEEAKKEEEEEEEEEEDGGSTFAIAKPPIIFVNDLTKKHPNINDEFTPTDGERKRWKKNGGGEKGVQRGKRREGKKE
ncbi:hypothetical protein niasHS_017505 [Heterodera schachtii]|uniref:Domain of unknown function DB domain-containing protein n=1 Tax=Heterodera schachtii TaxID=97005 RepID=A0ABD2HZW9_HETSC